MIDETISHYKILEKLGEGGMGVVYKAEDIKLKRTVALKFLPTHLTTDREARERFQREAQAVAALSHPNIITIYEIGEYEEQIFTALEYIEGESLQEKMSKRVKNSPSLTVNEIFSITIQICEGLSKAHKGGIVHRDIKPGNIFIDRDGQVKILDFGLAKLKWVSGITKESSRLGTICYMSPEQIHGDEVDYRTDIWSVGVVLYQMLTGELPFKGDYEQIVVYQIINVKPEAVSKLCPGISQKLEQVVNRTLEKERVNRYHHIDELRLDLKRLLEKAEEGDHSSPKAFKRESIIKEIRQVGKKDYYRTNILKYVRILLSPRRNKILLGIAILLFLGFFLLKPIFFEKALVSEALSIAVISFENKTGDKAYDYLQAAIPNLLITSLEQSKYLRVTTWERLFDLLKQIGKGDIEFIDRSLGIELCHMDGVDAVVWGSFIKNGNVFTMELKVLDLNTENIVKTASSKGEGVSSILSSQIDELSREISRGMGISDRIIKSAQIPIAEVTTTSMDAYNYFLRGREDSEKFYHDNARQFLEKAVQLDSTFAVANLYLALVYGALGNTKKMKKAFENAKIFSLQTTEKERLYIEAEYANVIERDLTESIIILKQMAKKYPKEKRVHFYLAFHYRNSNSYQKAIMEYNRALKLDPNYGEAISHLAYTYALMQEFEKAIQYYKKYASVSPGDANPFDCIAETYLRMGKLDKAKAKYREALEVKLTFFESYWRIAYVYALKENYSEAMQWINQFIKVAPSSGVKAEGYLYKGFYNYWGGSLQQSQNDLNKAEKLAEEVENYLWKAYVDWMKGWIYLEQGDFEKSRRYLKRWFEFIIDYPVQDRLAHTEQLFRSEYNFYLGLIDLKERRIESARSRLHVIESFFSEADFIFKDKITFYYYILLGEVLLAENSIEEAIEVCKNIYPLGMPPYMVTRYMLPYNLPFPNDILARVYIQKGGLDKAIAEYERLITFDPNYKDRRLIHPKCHYRLAKLYEEKGKLEKAIEEYKKFLEIWRNADEDQFELIDAKTRLASLLEKM